MQWIHLLKRVVVRRSFYYPLMIFLVSRLMLVAVSFLGDSSLLNMPDRKVVHGQVPPLVYSYPKNFFIDDMTRWDGAQFISIPNEGYFYSLSRFSNVAFFPLFSLSMFFLSSLTHLDLAASGVVLSNLYFLMALYVTYFFVQERWGGEKVASATLLFLAAFPTSFFYSAVYSESLFLLLSVSAFWLLEKKRWIPGGFVIALATATRVVGLALIPVLLLFLIEEAQKRRLTWRKDAASLSRMVAAILISPLGIIGYSLYLYSKFKDPFAFLHAQSVWGSNNNLLHTLSDISGLLGNGLAEPRMAMAVGSLLGNVFFAATIHSVFRLLDHKYALYALILFLIPLGVRAESLMRYYGLIFPLFVGLSMARREEGFKQLYLFIATGLQVTFFLIFINLGGFY